jgi:hypothetical protein
MDASAIYESMFFMGWIGQRPEDFELIFRPGMLVPDGWCENIASRVLACGIKVTAEVRGLTVYDFAEWPRGVAQPSPGLRTIGQVSQAAKPALIWRLRVLNSHQTLLHAAEMFQRNESPIVTRIHAFDLYRFDYDEAGDGAWYRPLGGRLPAAVTMADQFRQSHIVPITTFDLSLDWLQAVVANNALIEFDLLNQTQVALVTHDYALAVVAGWTICELRLRALGSQLAGGVPQKISLVISALSVEGMLSGPLADRINDLRVRRNNWLHSGNEPNEHTAVEAALLAAELLRSVVPDLTVRPPMGLLIL